MKIDFGKAKVKERKVLAQVGYMSNNPQSKRYLVIATGDPDRFIWIYEDDDDLPTLQTATIPQPTEHTIEFYEGDKITIEL